MKRFLIAFVLGAVLAIAAAPSALATGGCEESEAGCPNEGVADSALKNVERRPGGVYVEGWARDPDTSGPIDATISIDGIDVATLTANKYHASWYVTGYHGFREVVPARSGSQVCVQPIEFGGQPWALGLGDCKQFTVSVNPTGAFESVTADATTIRARGWAFDPDTADAIAVRFTVVDGTTSYPGGVLTAGEARPDVSLPGVGYGDRHGFAATITRPSRWTEVCAVAVNVGDGSDRSLGCRSIPPSVEITSAGLSPDLNVSSAVGGATGTAVAADASVLLLATGRDWHGGVKSVGLTGESTVTCADVDGELRQLRRPLAATSSHPDTDATAGPATRAVQIGFDVPTLLAECGRLATWRSLRVELRARAESFGGMVATTGLVTIHHLVLKVATFNIRWSALPPVCGDPFQPQPAEPWSLWAWAKPCPDRLEGEPVVWFPTQDADETLRRWGRDLAARADVVALTEVGTAAQAHTIAAAAGLPHVYTEDSTRYADVAVLSRFPIVAKARHAIPPHPSMIRDVTLDVAGIPHRVLGTHWENDGTPDTSHPDRVASAARAVDLLAGDVRPVFLAGDLNAHRDQDEVRLLADAGLEEACPVRPVPVADPDKCPTIDLVFTRGPYRVTAYRHSWVLPEDTRDPTHPSDHPFVLATYERTA